MPWSRIGTTVWSKYARIGSPCTSTFACTFSAAFAALFASSSPLFASAAGGSLASPVSSSFSLLAAFSSPALAPSSSPPLGASCSYTMYTSAARGSAMYTQTMSTITTYTQSDWIRTLVSVGSWASAATSSTNSKHTCRSRVSRLLLAPLLAVATPATRTCRCVVRHCSSVDYWLLRLAAACAGDQRMGRGLRFRQVVVVSAFNLETTAINVDHM